MFFSVQLKICTLLTDFQTMTKTEKHNICSFTRCEKDGPETIFFVQWWIPLCFYSTTVQLWWISVGREHSWTLITSWNPSLSDQLPRHPPRSREHCLHACYNNNITKFNNVIGYVTVYACIDGIEKEFFHWKKCPSPKIVPLW